MLVGCSQSVPAQMKHLHRTYRWPVFVQVAVQVAQGKLDRAAAVVRPPGHHAEADKPMGFCLYNNVAVAAHCLVHQLVSRLHEVNFVLKLA